MGKDFELSKQMENVADEIKEATEKAIEEALSVVPRETAQDLRKTSPRNKGDYARGWTYRKRGPLTASVFNKTDWQLTHLLEDPHKIKNKKGEYGRTSIGHGQVVHIEPAQERAQKRLTEEIEKNLEKYLQ